jgi:hypothetical protein
VISSIHECCRDNAIDQAVTECLRLARLQIDVLSIGTFFLLSIGLTKDFQKHLFHEIWNPDVRLTEEQMKFVIEKTTETVQNLLSFDDAFFDLFGL